jgi:hypothetical protein
MVNEAWVAYIVVGLAVSMIASLGMVLMSLSRENTQARVDEQGHHKDG